MRGDKSTRNSSPLLVIDGIPVTNSIGGGPGAPTADAYNGGTDSGDIFSTINPEDIQSINFLKGASAAALYGSQGSNGAILVTTKRELPGEVIFHSLPALLLTKPIAFQNCNTIIYKPHHMIQVRVLQVQQEAGEKKVLPKTI